MKNNSIYNRLENSVMKIYESLYDNVNSGADIKEIEDKLDIIMDALGLSYNESENNDIETEDTEIEVDAEDTVERDQDVDTFEDSEETSNDDQEDIEINQEDIDRNI